MKKVICSGILGLLVISSNVLANESCQLFAQNYYNWYVLTQHSNFAKALKAKKEVFSSDLLKKLEADLEASANSPGEIVGLDFDPVLNSQDPDSKYTVSNAKVKNDICTIDIHRKSAQKNDQPDVTAKLSFKSKQWRFVNFLYKGNKNQKNTDLLSILKSLEKERIKSPVQAN